MVAFVRLWGEESRESAFREHGNQVSRNIWSAESCSGKDTINLSSGLVMAN